MIYEIGKFKSVIHHVDDNPWNDDINNLTIMHHACHMKHHRDKRPPVSLETRAKMSAWQKGKPKSAEARANISAAAKRRRNATY